MRGSGSLAHCPRIALACLFADAGEVDEEAVDALVDVLVVDLTVPSRDRDDPSDEWLLTDILVCPAAFLVPN